MHLYHIIMLHFNSHMLLNQINMRQKHNMKHQMHFVQLNQLMQIFSLTMSLYYLGLLKNPKELVALE